MVNFIRTVIEKQKTNLKTHTLSFTFTLEKKN